MKYVCDLCGYVYDPALGDPDNGVEAGTEFADLPEDCRPQAERRGMIFTARLSKAEGSRSM